MDLKNLCMGCMEEKGNLEVCPICSYSEAGSKGPSIFLRPRTVLVDKYLIGRPLGQGGFGITYLAWDLNLNIKIAVKEFFPQGLVSRDPTSKEVVSFTAAPEQQFEFGLERFLHEARTLARFADHANIVTVRDFFRANGTAYMVMNYIEGMTLEEYLDQAGGRLSFDEARDIMMPVIDALREVHLAGIMHRDISPDNIFIDNTGKVVLIDFGAARQEMSKKSKGLSVILKAGYAPEEQYRTRGEQGPWTDVYAVAATTYRAVTGQVPLESIDRLADDSLERPSDLGANINMQQEQVLLKALALKAKDRYRSMEEFQAGLMQTKKIQEDREAGYEEEPADLKLTTGLADRSENKVLSASGEEQKKILGDQSPEDAAVTPGKEQKGVVKKPSSRMKKGLGLAAAVIVGGLLVFGAFSILNDGEDVAPPEDPGGVIEDSGDDNAGIDEPVEEDDNDAAEEEPESVIDSGDFPDVDREIVVGSKEFTEQVLLGQITIAALEHYGISTIDKVGFGGTSAVRTALEQGDIDLYWEYTGTALVEFMGHEALTESEEAYAAIAEWDEAENDLVWLQKTGFNNTYTIMMRQEDAENLGVRSISDLADAINSGVDAPTNRGWVFACAPEYAERADGQPALVSHYGFDFDEILTKDLWATYDALKDGEAAVAMGFATDARIELFELVNLEDDLQFHPVYNCAPVVPKGVLEEVPHLADILSPIARALDDQTMSALNMEVDINNRPPDEVALEWLQENDFLQ